MGEEVKLEEQPPANEGKQRKVKPQKPPKQPKQPKEAKPQKEPRQPREPKQRRERVLDATDTFVPDSGEETMNDAFRKRLAYLMNGNNSQGKPVNIQELADAVGVSRPAIRKYLKPKGGTPTTPSASTVCEIARYFGTTPDFLLGFDTPDAEHERRALESDYYNALGLNQRTIDRLKMLRSKQADERTADMAAAFISILDKLICDYADGALEMLEERK